MASINLKEQEYPIHPTPPVTDLTPEQIVAKLRSRDPIHESVQSYIKPSYQVTALSPEEIVSRLQGGQHPDTRRRFRIWQILSGGIDQMRRATVSLML